MLNAKIKCGENWTMNKKVTILRAINLLQRLSQAYYTLNESYNEDIYDADGISVGAYVENMMIEVQQQIIELNQLVSEYSEHSCEVCERRIGLDAADNL